MTDLRECPFCQTAGTPVMFSGRVKCRTCGTYGPANDSDGTKWNSRPPAKRPPAMLVIDASVTLRDGETKH